MTIDTGIFGALQHCYKAGVLLNGFKMILIYLAPTGLFVAQIRPESVRCQQTILAVQTADGPSGKPAYIRTRFLVFTEVELWHRTLEVQVLGNQFTLHLASASESTPNGGTPIHTANNIPSKYLPYEAQHVLLNTVQRLLEESCFDFAKKWFPGDHRVLEWTSPAQVEIPKWRDLLGAARIPHDALDGNVQTPLRVLLQEATYIRNNAVHRSQVFVEDILKMLTSSIQLTRMLRDQTRRTKIEDIRGRLIHEVNVRDDNRSRATVEYRKTRDDIDRRKEPMFKKLDKLRDEEDDAVTVFEKDSAQYDKMLQSSMVKFINQVIHTGEEVARIAPAVNSAPKPLPIMKNNSAATDGKLEKSQGRDDDYVQFISKSDFEVATSESRKPRKESAQDVGPGSKDKETFFKQDHVEDVMSSIRPAPGAATLVEVQSTPGSRNRGHSSCVGAEVQSTPGSRNGKGSSCGGAEGSIRSNSKGATPRTLSVVNGHSGTKYDLDSPSRQLELEANMANSIRELSIDEYDMLENLDAELDNQLVRTMDEARMSVDSVLDQMNSDVKPSVEEPVPNSMVRGNSDGQNDTQSCRSWTEPCVPGRRVQSSELKMTDRSFAPPPDVEMSGTDTSNAATANGSTNLRKVDIPRTAVGSPVVEFGKPWEPTTNGSVSIIRTEKSQERIPQIVFDLPSKPSVSIISAEKSQERIPQTAFDLPSKPPVSIIRTEKSNETNLSNMHLWRKRKAVSPLSERPPASYNSMISTRPPALPVFGNPSFPTGVVLNATGTQSTTSFAGLPMITSFGDVARFANIVGFNPTPSVLFAGVGHMGTLQMGKPQGIQDTDVFTSRQAATWERRRILVGCLSFTPSKAEVEKLFLGYNVTRIDFPELWILETETKPAGCVFVDLVTSLQAKLAIQNLSGEEPKIRNCRVSIMLATDPWKAPNASRRILSAVAKNKNNTGLLSSAAETVRKSEPIGKRTRSFYAAAQKKGFLDGQSSKRQKS
ncbi:hypothetical protein V502_07028 [Pseudogymnoascus sp. VKM F-4520 (FW-2644)]|nr:hypothetical protein V502_07028 [Pseudogymnoascus sp. VKM F-4520 (FW-2644)]